MVNVGKTVHINKYYNYNLSDNGLYAKYSIHLYLTPVAV